MRNCVLALVIGVVAWALGAVEVNAQDDKPLAPGWLSLDSTVGVVDKKIAEGKSALEKALGINIGGFLDASYTWSGNHPGGLVDHDIRGRYFDQDHNDIVFNDFNITIDKPEKDWGVGFHLAADFGRTAELLREVTYYGVNKFKGVGNGGEPSAELREAYLTTTVPVGAGLQIKGGLFVTTLGMEVIPTPGNYNENISRSFLFNLAVPLRHMGMLFTYPVHKIVNASAGVVTGWDDPHDHNHTPSFLGGVTVTPNDKFSFASNMTLGEEPTVSILDPNRNTARFVISNVWTIKANDATTFFFEYTWGRQRKASLGGTRAATWQGVAGIVSHAWTDRFSTALRGEFLNDRDGARIAGTDLPPFHANVRVGEMTLTGAYKFTKMLLGRAEVRQDWSGQRVYRVGNTGTDTSNTTLAVQLIYSY